MRSARPGARFSTDGRRVGRGVAIARSPTGRGHRREATRAGMIQLMHRLNHLRWEAPRIDARIAAVQARLDDAPVRRVLMVVGQTPLVAVGTGTFQDELIRMAHGDNLAARAGGSWPRLSIEFAIAAAPEVIIDIHYGRALTPEQIDRERAVWKTLSAVPAVRTGRVVLLVGDEFVVPGPRLADAAEAIADAIHPLPRRD